jgi:hypothetical protein
MKFEELSDLIPNKSADTSGDRFPRGNNGLHVNGTRRHDELCDHMRYVQSRMITGGKQRDYQQRYMLSRNEAKFLPIIHTPHKSLDVFIMYSKTCN